MSERNDWIQKYLWASFLSIYSLDEQRICDECVLGEARMEQNVSLDNQNKYFGIIQIMFKLGAKDLRKTRPTPETFATIKRNPVYLVLDRVIDTYNIGSLFRLADAIAAEKLYICGESEYPPNSRIHKAAVGTEEWVPWEKKEKTVDLIKELKGKGVQIITIEQSPRAVPITKLTPSFPCAIVVGNETDGVSGEVLDESDIVVELPMFGVNKSLNVWGTAAIAAYRVLESI